MWRLWDVWFANDIHGFVQILYSQNRVIICEFSLFLADRFQKLSRIYGVLTDPAAKASYDKWIRIKEMIKKRNEELSAKRRKLKESLESKENEHYATLKEEHEARVMMKSQIERLREQSQVMVQQHQEQLRTLLQNDSPDSDSSEADDVVIQATWERGSSYSSDQLRDMFNKYGQVEGVVKKKTKALISFAKPTDATNSIKNLSDVFSFKWISGQPPVLQPVESSSSTTCTPKDVFRGSTIEDNGDDYERQVMERLRRAQRKREEESELRDKS